MMLFLLVFGHALADYPLQGEFLSTAKNRNTDIGRHIWRWCLPAHGLIHGGIVALITGSAALGLAEAIAHSAIDFYKCEGRLSFDADQALHIACKLLWVAAVFFPH